MKSCELCKSPARMYCESDQASLCWDCDSKVHSANFLVARHSRSLLCHVCQSPTAWSASGERLGRTISVCESCAQDGCDVRKDRNMVAAGGEEEGEGCNEDEIDAEDEYNEDDEDDDEDDEDELSGDDEDADNQVVPWSSSSPPLAASSSSSEEFSSRFCNGDRDVSLKRTRENASDLSDDDNGCSSSLRNNTASAPAPAEEKRAAFVDSTRPPLKNRRTESNRFGRVQHGPSISRSEAIVKSLNPNPRAVDLDSTLVHSRQICVSNFHSL